MRLLCRIKTTLKIKNLSTPPLGRISPWAVCRAQRRLNLTASKTFRSYSLLLHESLLEQREKEIIYLMKTHNNRKGFGAVRQLNSPILGLIL